MVRIPGHIDHALGLLAERNDVGAIGTMHRHSPSHRHEAHDGVSRHRGAAAGDPDQNIVEPLDDDGARGTPQPGRRRRLEKILRLFFLGAKTPYQPGHHRLGGNLPLPKGRVQGIEIPVAHPFGDFEEVPVPLGGSQAEAFATDQLAEVLPAL